MLKMYRRHTRASELLWTLETKRIELGFSGIAFRMVVVSFSTVKVTYNFGATCDRSK